TAQADFWRTECDNDGRLSSLRPMGLLGRRPRMSLPSHASAPIPDETQRGARAAFPRGHRSLQVAARLGPRSHDAQCAALCPTRRSPPPSPPPPPPRRARPPARRAPPPPPPRRLGLWPRSSRVRQGCPSAQRP